MKETPYYVFVTGPHFMNQTRTTEAISKLWKRLKITHPDRVFTLVRMDSGGAPMHAAWWATGMGHPIIFIPCPMKPNGAGGNDRDLAAGVRRVLDWLKVDALIAFREKGHEGRPVDAEVQTCIDECAEEFIKTYIVES